MRLDQALLRLGLVSSRTKAKELIEKGLVEVLIKEHWTAMTRSSFLVDESQVSKKNIRLQESLLNHYVSRAGVKLHKFVEENKIDVTGVRALDLGQSTGGFSQCLLEKGAAIVVGLDVGHNQLSQKLKDSENYKQGRLISCEGSNVKDLLQNETVMNYAPFDLVVMDLSFISQKPILKLLNGVLREGGELISLVKPQFELGAKNLNKKGVVKDSSLYHSLQLELSSKAKENNFDVKVYSRTKLEGRDGNQEFFLWAVYKN